jgi:hypothetical protein
MGILYIPLVPKMQCFNSIIILSIVKKSKGINFTLEQTTEKQRGSKG